MGHSWQEWRNFHTWQSAHSEILYFWTGFHHQTLTNQISHSLALCMPNIWFVWDLYYSFLLLMNYCGSLNVKKIITKFVPTSITQVTNGRKTNELQKGCSFKTPFSYSVSESNALHIIYYCLGFRNKGYFQWLPNTYH